jgi:hypothetical protein
VVRTVTNGYKELIQFGFITMFNDPVPNHTLGPIYSVHKDLRPFNIFSCTRTSSKCFSSSYSPTKSINECLPSPFSDRLHDAIFQKIEL